jgi:protein gp37
MADNTKIEWTEATWNPITGCSVHSAGCTNCYAMKMAWRLQAMANAGNEKLAHYQGTVKKVKENAVWTGKLGFSEDALLAPLRRKKPTRYFVNSMSDLFHKDMPCELIDRIFAVIALCPQHEFQVLTKRSDVMREYLNNACGRIADAVMELRKNDQAIQNGMGPNGLGPLAHIDPGAAWWPLANVWLGVSVENNAHRDRIIDLAQTPAAIRWISGEPLLCGLSLTDIPLNGGLDEHGDQWLFNSLTGEQYFIDDLGKIGSGDGPVMEPLDWVVAGGESGSGARPLHPDWARSLRDQCAAAGTPFFFKQWGSWAEIDDGPYNFMLAPDGTQTTSDQSPENAAPMRHVGKKAAGRLLDGVEHDGMPTTK